MQNLRMREEPECIRKWKVMPATWFRFRFQVPTGPVGLFSAMNGTVTGTGIGLSALIAG
jgi:hypothetical protein